MDDNRLEGAVRNVGGKIQDAVGGLTGDAGTQAEGKANQLVGKAQGSLGAAAGEARDLGQHLTTRVKNQPMTALLIAGGAGLALGLFMRR